MHNEKGDFAWKNHSPCFDRHPRRCIAGSLVFAIDEVVGTLRAAYHFVTVSRWILPGAIYHYQTGLEHL